MKLLFRTKNIALGASALALLLVSLGTASAAPTSNTATYSIDTCIVSGDTLDPGDSITKVYDGREVQFCCKKCVKTFEKDQASYVKKLDQEIIKAQRVNYPLETCVVSGEAFGGEMGDAIDYVQGNRLVRLCCKSCKKDLAAEPAKFLEKLDAAVVTAQLKDYPTEMCPISGKKLGGMGDPYKYVFAGKLVQFCCGGCIASFDENPQAAMTAVYGDASEGKEGHKMGGHKMDGHKDDHKKDKKEKKDDHSGHNH